MSSKFYILGISLLFTISAAAQTTGWSWAHTIGATGSSVDGLAIARDGVGGVYVAGTFNSATLTIGGTTLNTQGGTDVVLVKYDEDGNVLWAKGGGSINADMATGVATDAAGNVYITGTFGDITMSLDTATLINAGDDNIFIAKFNPLGEMQWARTTIATNVNRTYGLAVTAAGDVYIGGMYVGAGLKFGATTLPFTNGLGGLFVAKYNTQGVVQWANAVDGPSYDRVQGLAVDAASNVYITGTFNSGGLSFPGDTISNSTPGNYAVFVASYGATGNLRWAKSSKGRGEGLSIATGTDNEIYVTGFFQGDTLAFDDSIMVNGGAHDIFLARFNAAGKALWIKKTSGSLFDFGQAVSADKQGQVYMAGYFASPSITFDTAVITKNGTTSSTNTDMFVAAYDSSGSFIGVLTAGAGDPDMLNGVAAGAEGEVFVTGRTDGPSFNAGNVPVTSTGHDMYTAKVGEPFVSIREVRNKPSFSVYPNPSAGQFYLSLPVEATHVQVLNMVGQVLQSAPLTSGQRQLMLNLPASGIYFIQVSTGTGTATQKVVVGR